MICADQVFQHARAALDHCTWTIGSLRARVGGVEMAGSRQQRFALRGALYDLEKRRDYLRALHAEMAVCPSGAFADHWRAFQAGYDDFLEAARAGRMELDRIGHENPVWPSSRGSDRRL